MDTRKYSLTEGSISQKLLLVSMPIIGNQLIQMLYNLTDMFWLGRVGSGAVAAAGTVGMYMWLSMAFSCFGSRGAEIGVSQSIGRQDENAAQHYAQTSLAISLALGIFFGGVLLLFCRPLVAFFAIEDPAVVAGAEAYLRIISIGIPFSFINMAAAGIFVGGGNARTPFYISALSLITNMILDPILIFGLGMGITGAAAATIIAQILGCILILIVLCRHPARPFAQLRLFVKPVAKYVRQIFRWTVPIALESFLFTILTMLITRFVSGWGTEALAAQKLGSQVESLSWLIAGGFSSAVAAFVGQNYGAKKWSRIRKGFSISFGIMLGWGVVATLILLLFSQPIFTAFFPNEPTVVAIGTTYLHILAVCQIVACLEGIASGAFRGIGKTLPPSVVSIVSNTARVVAAYFLQQTSLGLDGIWWAFSIGAGVRGLWLFIWYCVQATKYPKTDGVSSAA